MHQCHNCVSFLRVGCRPARAGRPSRPKASAQQRLEPHFVTRRRPWQPARPDKLRSECWQLDIAVPRRAEQHPERLTGVDLETLRQSHRPIHRPGEPRRSGIRRAAPQGSRISWAHSLLQEEAASRCVEPTDAPSNTHPLPHSRAYQTREEGIVPATGRPPFKTPCQWPPPRETTPANSSAPQTSIERNHFRSGTSAV